MKYTATCLFGLEGLLGREIDALGYKRCETIDGRVTFEGDESAAPRANINLRFAERVYINMGTFPCTTFDSLFEGTRSLPWEEFISKDDAFPVSGHCIKSKLFSVPDCQKIVKKAIAARLGEKYGLVQLPEDGAKYQVQFALMHDRAALLLDTSGEGLHKRGYRAVGVKAPLRETLAAAMVTNGPWRPWLPFFDPMCGSGTLCIEAAMVALDRAPGLLRPFDMERWDVCDQAACKALRQEARERFEAKKAEGKPEIFGSDVDTRVLNLSLAHLRQAGLAGLVQFRCQALDQAQNPFPDAERPGAVCTNPPYGERLLDVQAAEALYRQLAGLMQRLPGWGLQAISSHKDFEKVFGRRADKKRRVYNGRIECEIFNFYPPRPGK